MIKIKKISLTNTFAIPGGPGEPGPLRSLRRRPISDRLPAIIVLILSRRREIITVTSTDGRAS
jgi:hypothetical protein